MSEMNDPHRVIFRVQRDGTVIAILPSVRDHLGFVEGFEEFGGFFKVHVRNLKYGTRKATKSEANGLARYMRAKGFISDECWVDYSGIVESKVQGPRS